MKKFVPYILGIVFVFSITITRPQNPVDIQINWAAKHTLLNGFTINKTTNIYRLRSILGKESRALTASDNPTKLYIWDSLGINFIIDTSLGILEKMDIYCIPGKQAFETSPAKFFTGKLQLNNQPLSLQDSIAHLRSITDIPFEELSPGFYWYIAAKSEFAVCIAYSNKQRRQISMVYVLFNRDESSEE